MALPAALASWIHRSHPKLHLIERQHIIQYRYETLTLPKKENNNECLWCSTFVGLPDLGHATR